VTPFGKSLRDEEWLDAVMPDYRNARTLMGALSNVIRNNSIEDQAVVAHNSFYSLSALEKEVKHWPKPPSKEA